MYVQLFSLFYKIEKFIVIKTTVKTSPNKTAIKKFLNENEKDTIEGAMLVVNENLQIKWGVISVDLWKIALNSDWTESTKITTQRFRW